MSGVLTGSRARFLPLPLLAVTLVHLVILLLGLWLLSGGGPGTVARGPVDGEQQVETEQLMFFDPAVFLGGDHGAEAEPEKPIAAATDRRQAGSMPARRDAPEKKEEGKKRAVTSRHLTFSRAGLAGGWGQGLDSGLGLVDLQTLNEIDAALQDLFFRHWHPPQALGPGGSKLSAKLELSLAVNLGIEEASLAVSSGDTEVDASIFRALEKVRSLWPDWVTAAAKNGFPQSLPVSFANSRYDCRIQFQIE